LLVPDLFRFAAWQIDFRDTPDACANRDAAMSYLTDFYEELPVRIGSTSVPQSVRGRMDGTDLPC